MREVLCAWEEGSAVDAGFGERCEREKMKIKTTKLKYGRDGTIELNFGRCDVCLEPAHVLEIDGSQKEYGIISICRKCVLAAFDGVEHSTPVETIREARHYAMQVRDIAKVHLTMDFYLRLQADKDYGSVAPIYDVNQTPKEGPLPIFGHPCEIHVEPCEKPFWFEGEDGKEIVVT